MSLEMRELLAAMPQVGTIEWISLRPGQRAPVQVVTSAQIDETGLAGDRFAAGGDAKRAVTLIQKEHITAVASILGRDEIDPSLLRRNIVVSGVNLAALKDKQFQIGDAVLFATGNCPPCSRMEENLGEGGYNAMRGHGGITARVVRHGEISVGAKVKMLDQNDESESG